MPPSVAHRAPRTAARSVFRREPQPTLARPTIYRYGRAVWVYTQSGLERILVLLGIWYCWCAARDRPSAKAPSRLQSQSPDAQRPHTLTSLADSQPLVLCLSTLQRGARGGDREPWRWLCRLAREESREARGRRARGFRMKRRSVVKAVCTHTALQSTSPHNAASATALSRLLSTTDSVDPQQPACGRSIPVRIAASRQDTMARPASRPNCQRHRHTAAAWPSTACRDWACR